MYLSRLDIFGFKSFAQKVTMSFDSGITGIVGPNGCGKTNVVDAIRWVLGEQRPTLLRSDKMEDVIFAGTKQRKPLNVAEVSLVIQNTKGVLPSEYSEVTITRRVFRSGESEYILNRTPVRLKDIRDLFMDTGMGSDAYSVIELKMVETILSDRTDERRRLFEEAAGVTKYKVRRKETLRRLETVEADLTRVSDIVREVQKAVNSLERQAHKAQRYNTLTAQLRDLEFTLLTREFSGVVSRIEPLKEELDSVAQSKLQADEVLSREEELLEAVREDIAKMESDGADVLTEYEQVRQQIHENERQTAAAEERLRLLQSNCERYEEEIADYEKQVAALAEKKTENDRQHSLLKNSIDKAERTYDERRHELDKMQALVDEKEAALKASKDEVIAVLSGLTELRNRQGILRAQIENNKGRLAYLDEEKTSYLKDIDYSSHEVRRLMEEDTALRRQFADAQVALTHAEQQRASLEQDSNMLRDHDFEVRTEIERKQSRIEFIKSLLEGAEEIGEGARSLLSNKDWVTRVETTVGEALDSKPEHRIAIESALGDAIGYVIVRQVQDAYEAIRYLKESQRGKTTFVCLDRLPTLPPRLSLQDRDGVVGFAGDLVTTDSRFTQLVRVLFDDVVVVESMDAARKLAQKNPSLRYVTLEGEMATGRGVVRGGAVRSDEGGHVGKKKQLEELERELSRLQARREAIVQEYESKNKALSELKVKEAEERCRSIEQQITSVEIRLAQVGFEGKRAQESLTRNEEEQRKVQAELDALVRSLDELDPEIAGKERERTGAERRVEAATSEVAEKEKSRREFAERANEAHLTLLNLQADERSLKKTIEYTLETEARAKAAVQQRLKDLAASRSEIEILRGDLERFERTVSGLRQRFAVLSSEKKKIDARLNERRQQIHAIEQRLKAERQKHEDSLQAMHDLQIKLQELTLKSESLKERAKTDFDTELQLNLFPSDEPFDLEAARADVAALKEKVKSLGPINHAAFEEYKSEKQRLDFVVAQAADLKESQKTLVQTMDEINSTAQRLFLDTFEKIRANFIMIFNELFQEGDECDLRLEDGADPLEARIEIIAKPRGKRPTSIDLLSGGEKTLTATALLFAIYLVKPSPFCVLDEVDAPLDDANVDRFTHMIRKFSDNTQFIIVTHNKRTMEATGSLYGVTMEEEGVSKIVSVRFNGGEQKKEAV